MFWCLKQNFFFFWSSFLGGVTKVKSASVGWARVGLDATRRGDKGDAVPVKANICVRSLHFGLK